MAEININSTHYHQIIGSGGILNVLNNYTLSSCASGHGSCIVSSYTMSTAIASVDPVFTYANGKKTGEINVNDSHNHTFNVANKGGAYVPAYRLKQEYCPLSHSNCKWDIDYDGALTTTTFASTDNYQDAGEIEVNFVHAHAYETPDSFTATTSLSLTTCASGHANCTGTTIEGQFFSKTLPNVVKNTSLSNMQT